MSDKVKKLYEHNDDDTVFVQCGTKRKETDPVQTACRWTFDLSTWTADEITRKAIASLTIDAQRKWRAGELDTECTVTASDLEGDRKRGPSPKNARDFIAQMMEDEGPEAVKAWLEEQGLAD